MIKSINASAPRMALFSLAIS